MQLIARRAFTYRRRALVAGEAFAALSRSDHRELVAAQLADPAPLAPETPAAEALEPAPRARRAYRRRDLVAEGEL